MRCAERGRNGADFDPEHVCDRAVVKVGVVAKEQRFALARWESRNPCAEAELVVTMSVNGGSVNRPERLRERLARDSPSLVDHDSPDPRLDGAAASERPPLAHCCRERSLDGIATAVHVAADRRSDASEMLEPVAVEVLEVCRRRSFSLHIDMSLTAGRLFRRPCLPYYETGASAFRCSTRRFTLGRG